MCDDGVPGVLPSFRTKPYVSLRWVALRMQDAAISSMSIVCASVGNRDVDPFIPALISCIARPAEVPDCVHKLSATTFVQVLHSKLSCSFLMNM